MSRKTKREKILAQYRRKLSQIEEERAVVTEGQYSFRSKKSEGTLARTVNVPLLKAEDRETFGYVASDLKRIVFLTLLAIGAQLVLWYLLEKKLISLF